MTCLDRHNLNQKHHSTTTVLEGGLRSSSLNKCWAGGVSLICLRRLRAVEIYLLKTSAAMGIVELTGLDMMATSAFGQNLAHAAARSLTIPAQYCPSWCRFCMHWLQTMEHLITQWSTLQWRAPGCLTSKDRGVVNAFDMLRTVMYVLVWRRGQVDPFP